jgi:hypothetical protein
MGAIGNHPVALAPLEPMAAPRGAGGLALRFARDGGGCQDRSMVSIGIVVLGVTDLGRAIGFWTRVLARCRATAGRASARGRDLTW